MRIENSNKNSPPITGSVIAFVEIKKMIAEKKNKSGPRGEHKVVFKGHLLPGFDKVQVIANIVRLTKLAPEKIEKKFFSGKVVIIRRAHTDEQAKKLQKIFTKAGLEVFILKDTTKKISHQHAELPKQSTKKVIAKKIKKSSTPLFAVALWVVFIILVYNLWDQYNINFETPDEVVDIEYSLANKPLLLLAHINVERLLSQKRYFMSNKTLSGDQTMLYAQLNDMGIQPKEAIKQIISAAYIENEQLVSQMVLLGHFSVNAVKNYILKHHNAEMLPETGSIRLRISQIDERTCEKGQFMEVSIEPERILISSDGYLDELHQLLKQGAGNVTDLSNWKEYRSDKLVSLALFNQLPGSVEKKAIPGASNLPMVMIQDLARENEPVDSLFASIGLQLLPPMGLIDFTLNSKDQTWLDNTQKELLTQIKKMKTNSQGLLNLQQLLSKLSLQQNTQPDLREDSEGDIGQLSMRLELDREFNKSVELSLRELVEKFFSIDLNKQSSSPVAKQKQKVQERINASPLRYWPQYKAAELKPFNKGLDTFIKPVWIQGPFALSIDDLMLETQQANDQVIIQLRGKGQNIDNVGVKQASIKVTEVLDQQGDNLLAIEKCQQMASPNEAFFSSFGGERTAYLGNQQIKYSELEVRQKIKLKKGIKFSQVRALNGEIELNLATRTQAREFAKTDKNIVISEYDTRILLKPSASDSLSYTISGNQDNILLIRALNKNKDYLSRVSQTSMDEFFGSGFSVSQRYQGTIAFIEIVYATEFTNIKYPFSLSSFPPYPSDNHWKYELEKAQLSSVASWDQNYQDLEALSFDQENNWNGEMQASWHNGPLNLALYRLKTSKHWGTSGMIMIKTPILDELRHNLSALEIYISNPRSDDSGGSLPAKGSSPADGSGQSYFYPLKADGYYMNGDFVLNKDKLSMDGQISFSMPGNNEAVPVNEVSGDIIIHLPVSKHSSTYTDLSLGAQWEDEGVSAKLVRLGSEIMELEISGNRDRLLQISLIDSDNKRISTTDIRQGLPQQGNIGNIIVNYHGAPAKAVLTVSEGQQTRRYPFKLELKK